MRYVRSQVVWWAGQSLEPRQELCCIGYCANLLHAMPVDPFARKMNAQSGLTQGGNMIQHKATIHLNRPVGSLPSSC
jgi:hypothetical protein